MEHRSLAPVVLVTGASSGIGRATAEAFAGAGYLVAVNYRTQRGPALELAGRLGGRAYAADVADDVAVEEMVRRIEAELGPISVAVCNAGFYTEQPLAEVTDELWDRTLRTLLGGCFHVARAVVPGMRKAGGGSIVTVASELALIGGDAIAPYVAAKAAVIGLTRSLARELAPTIRVNSVAPGAVDTPLLPDRDRGPSYTSTVPLGRIGRPAEIASAILHLAEAPWTTGQVYSPNGGVVIQ
ncbi:MAG: SDR family oxidoreductase [Chloroflexi bacterium]|nr:SDR family oxidoreductase [Chloroflexota bacterium]